jgi:hypothetical protein
MNMANGMKRQRFMSQTYPPTSQPGLSHIRPTSHPNSYPEPLHSPSASSHFDEGLFSMDMPCQDLPVQQQQYPDLSEYEVAQYPWAQQQPQQHTVMQDVSADTLAMDESFALPVTTSAPLLPEDYTNDLIYAPIPASNMMRGWIGRAPSFGDELLPRLDTNHLAPPAASIARSPSSASSAGSSSSRLSSSRRNRAQMTSGDIACYWCPAAFATSVELTHHLRSHAPYASRNHVCQHCEKRFQYRKDLLRHLPRHDPNRQKFYCPFNGCKYHSKGFGRRDHLERHVSSQHQRVDTPLGSSPA